MEADIPDHILFVGTADRPAAHHVRDREALFAQLPPCPVVAADRAPLSPVTIVALAATVWLPDLGVSEPVEVPPAVGSVHFEGWSWPTDASVVFDVDRDRALPALAMVGGVPPTAEGARIAGRPVAVERRDAGPDAPYYTAWVSGFLSDHARLGIEVTATTAVERDLLLAAVLTLEPMAA